MISIHHCSILQILTTTTAASFKYRICCISEHNVPDTSRERFHGFILSLVVYALIRQYNIPARVLSISQHSSFCFCSSVHFWLTQPSIPAESYLVVLLCLTLQVAELRQFLRFKISVVETESCVMKF